MRLDGDRYAEKRMAGICGIALILAITVSSCVNGFQKATPVDEKIEPLCYLNADWSVEVCLDGATGQIVVFERNEKLVRIYGGFDLLRPK